MPLSQQIIRSGGAKLFALTDGDGPRWCFCTPAWRITGCGRDFPHIQERCATLVETIPDAQGTCVPGCAHLVNLEHPDHVLRVIEDFLSL